MSALEDMKAVLELGVIIGGMKADVERLKSDLAEARTERDAAEKDRIIYLTRWEDRTKQLDECIEAAEKMRTERDVFKGEVERLSAELAIANGWEDTRARCS
jgi:uncharacterized small protein (DUF1192 family)